MTEAPSQPAVGGPDLSLVSVVYEAEVPLQLLQARSVARFVPPGAVAGLVVLDNTRRGLPPGQRAELLDAYGEHGPALRVLRPADLGDLPGAVGWRHQQVLKLVVAEVLPTSRYVVLDAKNHFVGAWDAGAFVSPSGRMRARYQSYEDHPLRADLVHVLRYLGLDPAPHLQHFTATVTPFVLDVDLVRRLVQDVGARSGRGFAREFVSHDLTEFFLVSGWLLSRGNQLTDVYEPGLDVGPTLWARGATTEGVDRAVAAAREAMMFAVHRRAMARLDPGLALPVARLWAEAGVFPSVADGEEFVRAYRADLGRWDRRRRRRDLPHKLLAAPRALRRRLQPRVQGAPPRDLGGSRP